MMLSFSDSVFLPYDFVEYGKDLRKGLSILEETMKTYQNFPLNLDRLDRAILQFEKAALHVNKVNIITTTHIQAEYFMFELVGNLGYD